MHTTDPLPDKRAQRSREALLAAFFGLVLERRYSEFNVGDIIERANVARSTFYEHFASKNALLASSLEGPFSPLADSVLPADNSARLHGILQHFWDHRGMARTLLAGAMRQKVAAVLAGMIEQRLTGARPARPQPLPIPPRLLAIQLADGMLALIAAWLGGMTDCSAQQLAQALRRSVFASVEALRQPIRGD